MPRYLVTGGLGFIGSHLAHALLADSAATVDVVDCRHGAVFSAEEVATAIRAEQPGDLRVHVERIEDFSATEPYDRVYHLASVVGPAGVLAHAGRITSQIVVSTDAAIRIAQQSKGRLINVSTSEVYGGGVGGCCAETTPRVFRGDASARQEYAAAKLACEIAIENLCRTDQLDAVTVRPFNVAGPRQAGGGGFVLPRFLGQAALGRPLTVFGDGTQVRAFTDVRDVVDGLLLTARMGETGEVYNVGNDGNRCSIQELAATVLGVTCSAAGVIHVDPRSLYGPHFREAEDKYPDAAKLHSLGWQPRHSLADTVRNAWDFVRSLPREQMIAVTGLSAEVAEFAATSNA